MSPSQRRGIVKLLPKPGKDPRYIKNLRPITLLNVDFKILTKALSSRLSPLMSQFVHMDQKGFVKGRQLGEQIFDIYAVEHIAKQGDALLLLDIRKAFDSVSWSFLRLRLQAYGLPDSFVELITTLFKHKELRIYNNGFYSQPIFPTHGLAQGCSLSPLLFLLAIEGLAYHIRNSPRFEGISYKNREKRIGLVADDTALFLKLNEENLRNVNMILDHFAWVSGLKINVEKCELIPFVNYSEDFLNSVKHMCDTVSCNYKITSIYEGFTYLGIFICKIIRKSDHRDDHTNFKQICKRMVAYRFSMLKRQITCRLTRVTRSKALLFNQYVYRLTFACPPSKQFLNDLTKSAFDYIWDKGHWINMDAMYLHQSKGGYGALHVESHMLALRFKWLAKLCDDDYDEFWVYQLRQTKGLREPFVSLMRPERVTPAHFPSIPFYWRCTLMQWFRTFQCNKFPTKCSPYEAFHKVTQKRTVKQWLARGSSLILELFDRDMQAFLTDPSGEYNVICRDILKGNVTVKQIYMYLVSFVTKPRRAAIVTWSKYFPQLKEDELSKNWENYTIKCRDIPIPRIRDCHIMCLNVAFPTSMSFKWHPGFTFACPFCDSYNDTYIHRFWECIHVQEYWICICESVLSYYEADFSEINICMGIFDIPVLNFIVTVARYTILICSCDKIRPKLPMFFIHLQYFYKTHKKLWKNSRKFELYWAPLNDSILNNFIEKSQCVDEDTVSDNNAITNNNNNNNNNHDIGQLDLSNSSSSCED